MPQKRSSGLDFSDRPPHTSDSFEQYPDLEDYQVVHLQRNRTERRRLQGLQRTLTNASFHTPPIQRTFKEKFDVWLINDGGRHIFLGTWIFLQLLVVVFGFLEYQLSDDLVGARATYGITYRAPFLFIKSIPIFHLFPPAIARTAALVLYVNVAFLLLPVCRNFVSFLRRTPLNDIIPFDKNISFHKVTAWSIVCFTLIHILAHMVNFYRFAMADPAATTTRQRFMSFLSVNFTTGPGITGWIMTACLGIMIFFCREKVRTANYERFWYSHHLFIILFINWQLHGMFCMIKPDRPPFCSSDTNGVFWVRSFFFFLKIFLFSCTEYSEQRYWLVGGVIWIFERVLREVRSRHVTYISKVIQHPSNVMELQIKKERTTSRAGQYIFLSCPEVSYFQWHPFTLTRYPGAIILIIILLY
jgi:NADPH oxidase 2